MPHFAAITLDRFISTGGSISVDLPNQSTTTVPKVNPTNCKPWDYLRLEKRYSNSMSSTTRRGITSEHYATPESTLVSDSPSLFPASPHILDHKCSKPFLEKKDDASNLKNTPDEAKISADEKDSRSHGVTSESSSHVCLTASDSIISAHVNGTIINECQSGCINLENGIVSEERNGPIEEDGCEMLTTSSLCRECDSENLCDPHNSMSSCTSQKDGEELDIHAQSSRLATPNPDVEFCDSWEELSSAQNTVKVALEEELGEMRLCLAMETEKRKQAEEALENMQRRWERMREHLSLVGLTLPTNSTWKNETMDFDSSEEVVLVCQQVQVIRFVYESIGRGIAKAEIRTEMENQLGAKDIEITRLCDRLHYYKVVNREMSEMNQQALAERTRRPRERRKWQQRWIWGSLGVTLSIGVVAVACNYYLQQPSPCIVRALQYRRMPIYSQ